MDNTIVLYTSDHGDHAGEHGIMGKALFSLDSILRVPFIVSWPGVLPQGETREQLVETIDLYPTLCDLLGWPVPEVSGRSIADVITEGAAGREAVFSETRALRTVRTDRWKYAEMGKGGEPELYDLHRDPLESFNLAQDTEYQGMAEEMRRKLGDWEEATPPYIAEDPATASPTDWNYPRHEGWLILTGEWWPEEER